MNYTKNRLCWFWGSIALCLLLAFALWVNSGFAPRTDQGRAQRLARRYMLSELEPAGQAPDGGLMYVSGDDLVRFGKFSSLFFYPLEDRAAFFPGDVVFWSPYSEEPNCRAMELYAYDKVDGASSVELELWLRDEQTQNDRPFEATYTPRCTGYADGLAIVQLEQTELSSKEYAAFEDLSIGALFGDVTNGISYRATLRYYDAEGRLLDEVVREVLWD